MVKAEFIIVNNKRELLNIKLFSNTIKLQNRLETTKTTIPILRYGNYSRRRVNQQNEDDFIFELLISTNFSNSRAT